MNDLQKQFKSVVISMISGIDSLEEEIIDSRIDEACILPMFKSLDLMQIEEVRADIKSQFSFKLNLGTLIQEKNHEKWFLARKSKLEMKYWERYSKYLKEGKGFSINVVNVMDDILDTLTDLLGDPERNISYKRRGLIMGDVQSGKTANYTGLICKAVDAGYKVIVLLTGTIEKLRQQTQSRIDEGFVGRDSDAIIKQKNDVLIGVGDIDPSIHPMCLTSRSSDFNQQIATSLNFDLRNINGPVIFVIKKNSSVLNKLNRWLKKFNQNGNNPIDNAILVIDDEADNASINTKSSENPTTINAGIRELLNSFTKTSYVGYTATPYANIFIDPDSENDMYEDDLFPKDYIYSLDSPSNYIGARDIFCESGKYSNLLVPINEDASDPLSISNILPLKHEKFTSFKELPDDLKDAIAAFIIANVIQDIDVNRKRDNTHRSMLINISRFTNIQGVIASEVGNFLKTIVKSCQNYCNLSEEKALKDDNISRLKRTYDIYYENISIPWLTIQKNLYAACAGIVVQQINKDFGQDLDFSSYKDGLRVIAVGGFSLSRGLTLEGLVVSYFYRNSKMYDTLMQMGRWFGYRQGYDDLCRIWMSIESIEWYRYISDATDELKNEVKRYEKSDLTPKEFGLRVRSDLTSLVVTARNKMKNTESRTCVISLSGEVIETPELFSDRDKNKNNYDAVLSLIKDIFDAKIPKVNDREKGNPKFGFKNVPANFIIDMLEKITIPPQNENFSPITIINFIKDYAGNELEKWDIAFATGKAENMIDLGNGLKFFNPQRQVSIENNGKILKMNGSKRRLGNTSDGTFGIDDNDIKKVLQMSGKDNPAQKDYFKYIKRNPLLTIYYVGLKDITGDQSKENSSVFEDCKKSIFVGFGIGIPELSHQETKYAKYVLNKVAIKNMIEGEVDDWDIDEEDD